MIPRLLLAAGLTACCLPAQFNLYLLQSGAEVPVPGQYGFGTVSLGDHTDIPFRLRNSGTSSAALTVFSLAGVADFSFVNPPALPQTVSAGGALDFTIRFQPSDPGTSSATFTADGVSVILFGFAPAAAAISVDDGSGTLQPLMADATVDFGQVVRGAMATRRIRLTNPGGTALTIRNVAVVGAPFQLKSPVLPLALAPGSSASMEVDFTPTANGTQHGALEIEQRKFVLAGVGVDPPFPQPEIALTIATTASAQQGQLTVRLPQASKATGTGHVQIELHPSVPALDDNGIQFLITGNQTATFTVNQGDTVGHFGSQDSVGFQTGTTAGDITFKVWFDNSDVTAQATLIIPPEVMGIDSTQAQRTSGGLDLRISAFDNTRSASQLTFRFYDQSGNLLTPGAMTVNSTAAFGQFFGSSDLGGVFGLHAFFPVMGNPAQVASVIVEMVNSAGTARTDPLPFTTP